MLEIHFVDSYKKKQWRTEIEIWNEKTTLFGDCGRKERKERGGGGEENEKRRKGINSIRKAGIQL